MKRLGFVLPLLLAWTAASAAAPDGAAALKNTGALDRLVKGTGVYHAAPKGKHPVSWPTPPGPSLCRTTGSWARSAACTSIRTITSGSTTAPAR